MLDLGLPPPQFFLLVGQQPAGARELDFLRVDQLELLVEDVGSLVEPPFLFAEVAANSIDLDLKVLSPFEHVLLGGQFGLLANGVGLEPGGGEDLVGPSARGLGANRAISDAPASPISTPKSRSRKPIRETPPGRRATRSRTSAERDESLSGGAGANSVLTPSTAQTRNATHRHCAAKRASQKGNIERRIDSVKRSHPERSRPSASLLATCLQVASNTKTTVQAGAI